MGDAATRLLTDPAIAVLGVAALATPVSFYSVWGPALGSAAVLLGVVTLLASAPLTQRIRLTILSGVVLGLVPATFYIILFLKFAA